jgi:regulation of enolase protein 1 (concanavalin A-like superfamily)
MEIYAWLGDVERALGQYEECKRALHSRLKATPDPETLRLYQGLRSSCAVRGVRSAVRSTAHRASRSANAREASLPLVGRERELERLREAWRRARVGQRQLVILHGDAGIGKSRLGQEFLHEVEATGGVTLSGQAYALERNFLYQPLTHPLRRAQALIEQHGLEPCPPAWRAQVARLVPELQPEDEADGPPLEGSRGLTEGVEHFFLHLASQRPFCFFLDDLQHADPATGQFLKQLWRRADPASFLLLGSYREGELTESPWLAEWLAEADGEGTLSSLHLSPLSLAEVTSLLQELCEGAVSGASLESLGQRLHAESEGSPFIFWAILRQWFDQKILVASQESGWRVAAERLARFQIDPHQSAIEAECDRPREPRERACPRLPPPAAVQAVVRQRLARQREGDREILACAAVIGRRFTFETLRRATGQDAQALLGGLERLLTAALIHALPQTDTYDFQHDKFREVVYSDLMPVQRQRLHSQVGEALEAIYGIAGTADWVQDAYPIWTLLPPPSLARARAQEHAEELAWHFGLAVSLLGPERAAYYAYVAGIRARSLFAYETAAKHLLRARSFLEQLPVDAMRLAQLGEIIVHLAPILRILTGAGESAWDLMREYLTLCVRHNYPQGTARACTLMGQFLLLHGHLQKGETPRSMFERAMATLESHGLNEWIVYPQAQLASWLVWSETDLETGERLARECLEPAQKHRDRYLVARLNTTLMWTAVKRGDWDSMLASFEASLPYGGPVSAYLLEMLKALDRTCHQLGKTATFVELCRTLEDGYRRGNLHPPLRQWHLTPILPRPIPDDPDLREEFLSETLDPRLQWQGMLDGTRIDRSTRPGWLGVSPVGGANLWPDLDMNAPRLMATVRGNWVAQTCVEVGEPSVAFAGLLLWRDERNFVRLEVERPSGDRNNVRVEACVAARHSYVGRGQCDRKPVWLRVERVGGEVRGLCSVDECDWFLVGSIPFPSDGAVQVGLVAICEQGGSLAWFEQFLLWPEASS